MATVAGDVALPLPGSPGTGRAFELLVEGIPPGTLEVVSFVGEEAVSEPGGFDVEVAVVGPSDAIVRQLVGARAALHLRTAGARPRRFVGAVHAAQAVGWGGAGDRHGGRIRVEIRSRLAALGATRHSRVFADQGGAAVARAVLEAWGIPVRESLARAYLPWAYCVQYQESDLAFVARVLAAEGIFYFVAHDEPGDGDPFRPAIVVLGDSPRAFASFEAEALGVALPVALASGGVAHPGEAIHRLGRRVEAGPASIELRDHNPLNHALDLAQRAAASSRARPATAAPSAPSAPPSVDAAAAARDVYEYLPPAPLAPGAGRDEAAAIALEQVRARTDTVHGTSSSPRIVAGHVFVVDDCAEPTLTGAFVATRTRATGHVPHHSGDGAGPTFELAFEALAADRSPRPPRPAWAPRDTLDVADVVGADGTTHGQEIHTDSLGRVRVRFRWGVDRPGMDARSCWLRVVQPWSGAGFGAHFVPRVGMEVVVGFLGGDVNRPVVVGCVPNSSNPVPLNLPAQQTRSGIVTRSSPGGDGRNELLFEDAAGREELLVRAQRDLTTHVLRDEATDVRRDARLTVERDRTVVVRGDVTEEVGGGATRTVTGRSFEAVIGDRVVRVTGAATETFESARATMERGDASRDVRGRREERFGGVSHVVHEAESIDRHEAGGAHLVGTPSQPASWLHRVEGVSTLEASDAIELVADRAIRITCGESAIVIGPESVQIRSPLLRLEGDALESDGETVNFLARKTLRLEGEKLFARSAGASLTLTRDAKIDGRNVRLGASPDASDGPAARVAFPAPTTVSLVDQTGAPVAGARFVITLADGTRRAGRLDEHGERVVLGLDGSATIAFPEHGSWQEA